MDIKNKALKTGISVFLCIIVSNLMNLKYPFFVTLPSIMPMSNSAEETLKAGRNRLLGTLIGALVGVLFVFIYPSNAILSGIGIIIIIYLCNFIRWGNAAAIAGLVFISIMVGIKGDNPWLYSLHRIFNTFIGVCITIIVNNFIFRTNLLNLVNHDSRKIKEILDNLVKEAICYNNEIDISMLSLKVENVKDKLSVCIEEYGSSKRKHKELDNLKDIVNSLTSICDHFKIICTMKPPILINDENFNKYTKLYDCNFSRDLYNDTLKNTVFNYHLGEILNKLSHLGTIFDNN